MKGKKTMKKRFLIWALVLALCLAAAAPAMAANVFQFAEKTVSLFEGQSLQTELKRDGAFAEDADITYASSKASIASVSADGVVTALSKGQADISATWKLNGKKTKATMRVNVLRAVSKVTLNTTKLSVYDPDDPAVASLLKEVTEYQVIVLPAGTTVTLGATCTPTDASSQKVTFTSSDAGVAKISQTSMRAVQRGECDLTVASVQNPEVTETYRLLVIQPVKSIKIDAGDKTVAAGATLQLSADCQPGNASIPLVTWASKNPQVATVDENGVVTGVKRGTAAITATAADGSKAAASVTLNATQPVSGLTAVTPQIEIYTGRYMTAKVTVQPADASDKSVAWSSSDESVATVRSNGQVTGVKAGECILTATSKSNPEEFVFIPVTVSQMVTKIENVNTKDELSIKVGETVQTRWNVLPEDATDKGLTFRSNGSKIATVDAGGLVTGISRGTVSIIANAQDAGKKQGAVKVNVIQPVTGVSMRQELYYVQRGWSSTVHAVVQPRNANNQKVFWSSMDEGIATVRSNGTSTGSVYGVATGTTTIIGYTEDGGFTTSTTVRVGNFNGAVMVEELLVDANNKIRISLRNMSQDIILSNINFRIECFDTDGNPFVCNTDGVSTFFEGNYPYLLEPLDRTSHGSFNFKDWIVDRELGSVVLTVTGWKDADGYSWSIPESEQVHTQWTRLMTNPADDPEAEGVG